MKRREFLKVAGAGAASAVVATPAPSWAWVLTLELAVATSIPSANNPLAATPLALADWSLMFTAMILMSPLTVRLSAAVVAMTLPLVAAVLSVASTPTRIPPLPAVDEA